VQADLDPSSVGGKHGSSFRRRHRRAAGSTGCGVDKIGRSGTGGASFVAQIGRSVTMARSGRGRRRRTGSALRQVAGSRWAGLGSAVSESWLQCHGTLGSRVSDVGAVGGGDRAATGGRHQMDRDGNGDFEISVPMPWNVRIPGIGRRRGVASRSGGRHPLARSGSSHQSRTRPRKCLPRARWLDRQGSEWPRRGPAMAVRARLSAVGHFAKACSYTTTPLKSVGIA
jgi:hypothetical protein